MISDRRQWRRAVLMGAALAAVVAFAVEPYGSAAADQPVESRYEPLRERMARRLRARGWSDNAIVAAISTLPIVELRGAIPVAVHVLDIPWWKALPMAIAGNMLPVPFLLLLLGPLSRLALRGRFGRHFFEWLFARTRRKTAGIEKYETLGLAIFVAIPLPATGAWTGAIAAFLLGVRMHHALWAIALGVLAAGGIVTALTILGWWGALIAGIAVLSPMIGGLVRVLRKECVGE